MHPTHTLHRLAALALAGGLFVLAARAGSLGSWPFWIGLGAPDLSLLAGTARGLQRGQLHPRAVRLYNAAHNPLLPLALAAVALAAGSDGWLAAALGWGAHIAIDRAAGYGPRRADGFQRSAAAR